MNRHYLIYLQADDHFVFLDPSIPVEVQQKVHQMIRQNIPFTVCRQECEDYFKVAVNCIVHGRKYRVALGLTVMPKISQEPLCLSALLDYFNIQTQQALQQFIQRMQTLSCSVHVYGSYANQYFHHEHFIHHLSDLDLLIQLNNLSYLPQILHEILHIKTLISVHIDGEISLMHTKNISFNELIFALNQRQDQIIVKELHQISLQKIAEICGGILNVSQQYNTDVA